MKICLEFNAEEILWMFRYKILERGRNMTMKKGTSQFVLELKIKADNFPT
jgi:hypothetical protein